MGRSYYYNAQGVGGGGTREWEPKTNPEHDQLKFSTWPQRQGDSIRVSLEPHPDNPRAQSDAGGLSSIPIERWKTLDRWKHIAFITCRQHAAPWPRPCSGNECVRQLVRVYPCPKQLRFRYACTHAERPGQSGVDERSEPVSGAERIKIITMLQTDLTLEPCTKFD